MLAHVAIGGGGGAGGGTGGSGGSGPQAALHPDAEVPLNLKAEESPTSPCPGATMADDYEPADPAQTRHFMDVDDDADDDEEESCGGDRERERDRDRDGDRDRERDRDRDVAGHLSQHHNQHRQHLMNHQFQGLQSFQPPLQGLHGFHRGPPPPPPPPPLNLSLSVAGSGAFTGSAGRGALPPPPPPPPPAPSVAPLPQLILASGRLVPGLQVTQLLVPTPQGVASQTVLAIPVSHVSPGQIVNLALADGQVICTTLGQLLQAPDGAGVAPSVRRRPSSSGSAPPQSPPPQTPHPPAPPTSSHLSNGIASSINRLAANNCDLTITPAPLPPAASQAQNVPVVPPPPSSQQPASHPAAPLPLPLPPRSSSPSPPSSPASASPRGRLSPNSPDSDFLDDGQPTINQASSNMVDGINLDEIKEFAKAFKLRRLSLGLTQTQVGQALSVTEGPAYSQSAICRFEKLDITPKSAQKIKPVLEHWMKEAEERYKIGQNHLTEFIGMEPSKKRKRRTSFTPQALELLNAHFERNTHPSGTEITALAHQLGYDREVIRIWFCNKRQALKNTVRMMSKGLGVS